MAEIGVDEIDFKAAFSTRKLSGSIVNIVNRASRSPLITVNPSVNGPSSLP